MSNNDQIEDKSIFYIKEDIQDCLTNKEVDVENLSLNELLASERTNLANKRNILALKRNLQAAERTYSAWVRTGFSIVSAGVAFAGLLNQTVAVTFSNLVGSLLIIVGLLAFVYGWYGYYKTYKWLNRIATHEQGDGVPDKTDLVTVSIITIMLLITSVTAFVVIIF